MFHADKWLIILAIVYDLSFATLPTKVIMFFWSTRLLLTLAALPILFIRWQAAVAIMFALVIDLLTLIGMTLPTFGVWGEFVLVFPASVGLGLVLAGQSRVPLLVCGSALVVLHFSPYLDGLATGAIRAAVVLRRLPALGLLVLAVGLGFELTYLGRRWLRRRVRERR
jgi:hypothetical protein